MRRFLHWLWKRKNWWLLPIALVSVMLGVFSDQIFLDAPPIAAFLGRLMLCAVIPWLALWPRQKDRDKETALGEGFETVSLFCGGDTWQEIPISEIVAYAKKSVPQAQEKFSGRRIRFRGRVMVWENDEITLYALPVNIYTASWRKNDPYAAMAQKTIHPGDVITVTGTICEIRRTYFYIDDVEVLERVTEE